MTAVDTLPQSNAIPGNLLTLLAKKRKLAFCSLCFLIFVILVAISAPLISPADPLAGNISEALQSPSAEHWLGTDQLGRDVLSRLIWGTRPTLISSAQATTVALAIGITFGVVAGFMGGLVDNLLMAVSDILMSMPGMVILLIILSIFKNNMDYPMVVFGILISGSLMRIIRAVTLSVRSEVFIEAARVSGLSTPRILARHILPRIKGAVLIQSAMLTSIAILLSTGVAFLGFGVQPPNPSWGSMITEGSKIMDTNPTLLIVAGVATGLTVLACGVLGDGLRDVVFESWNGPRPARALRRTREQRKPKPVKDSTGLLQISGLRIEYGVGSAEREVVHGIDLQVESGETVGLVGESGSGKSATARAILGILKGGKVSEGSIVYDGLDITGISEFEAKDRKKLRIGYISQEPHVSLDPTWRVGAQLVESLRSHNPGLSKSQARKECINLLSKMQLKDPAAVARKYPHELSGGMAQRVAIARSLTGAPKLLIADEPTTALDVTVQAEILELLRNIQAATGLSILIITHDWGVVSDLCARAYVMKDGSVIENAPVLELVENPQAPYTRKLLDSNPAVMLAVGKGQTSTTTAGME